MIKRLIYLLSGFLFIALGIVLILLIEIGSSTVDAFSFYLTEILSNVMVIKIGTSTIITGIIHLIILFIIKPRKELLYAVIAIFLIGVFINMFLYFSSFFELSFFQVKTIISFNFISRLLVLFIAMNIVSIGTTFCYKSKLSASPTDLMVKEIASFVKSINKGRWIYEGIMLILSIILCVIANLFDKGLGFVQISVFTIIMGFAYGPIITFWMKILNKRVETNIPQEVI
jgi:uncharacterized membrane protein YczE